MFTIEPFDQNLSVFTQYICWIDLMSRSEYSKSIAIAAMTLQTFPEMVDLT